MFNGAVVAVGWSVLSFIFFPLSFFFSLLSSIPAGFKCKAKITKWVLIYKLLTEECAFDLNSCFKISVPASMEPLENPLGL